MYYSLSFLLFLSILVKAAPFFFSGLFCFCLIYLMHVMCQYFPVVLCHPSPYATESYAGFSKPWLLPWPATALLSGGTA